MYHPRDDRFIFGNINTQSLYSIWNGEKRKQVKEFLRTKCKYRKECQVCCKLNEVNKLIDFLKYPSDDLDVNFL